MAHDSNGLLIGLNDGQPTINPIGGRMVQKITDALTNDCYSIHDNVLPAGSPGPRPHRHHNHDEVFYVLSGTLTLRIGTEHYTVEAGSFIVVPRSAVHQPSNPTDQPVHVLLIFSPGGMDTFFLEVAERKLPLQAVPTDPAVLADLESFLEPYGYEFSRFDP